MASSRSRRGGEGPRDVIVDAGEVGGDGLAETDLGEEKALNGCPGSSMGLVGLGTATGAAGVKRKADAVADGSAQGSMKCTPPAYSLPAQREDARRQDDVALGHGGVRLFTLRRSQRMQVRAFVARTRELILRNPSVDVGGIRFPRALHAAAGLEPSVRSSLLEFQWSALTDRRRDPSSRHPVL